MTTKFLQTAVLLSGLLGSILVYADGGPSLKGLGLFGVPLVGFQNGTYKFDNGLDKGSMNIGFGGAKAGINVGPIYLGGEYVESLPKGSSDNRLNPTDKVTYPVLDDRLTSIGATLGLEVSRVIIWGTYFISEEAKKTGLKAGSEAFSHEYHGTGAKISVGYRMWKNAFFDLHIHRRVFDKFSSEYSANLGSRSDLASKLNVTTLGFTFSYIAKAEDLVQFK